MSVYVNTVDSKGDVILCETILDRTIDEITDTHCKTVGNYVFYRCANLHTAIFTNAQGIGNNSFYGCSKLSTVDFPVAESIGSSAFNGCYALATADFPAVASIDSGAFTNCSNLVTLILRSGTMATLANTNAFTGTPIANGTGYIYVSYDLYESYKADSVWSTYANQLLVFDCGENATWSLDNGVLTISGTGDMYYSYIPERTWGKDIDSITSVIFEDGISMISGLKNCTNLSNVYIPDSVSYINSDTLKGCTALTTIKIPNANMGDHVFRGCANLTCVDFGGAIILENVFIDCTSLKALVIRNVNRVVGNNIGRYTGDNAMTKSNIDNGKGYIYVPSALYDSYLADDVWYMYTNQFRKLEDWTVDGTTTGEFNCENRHMVRFFNSDGTLLGYKVVTTGRSASYDGTPVCPGNNNLHFNGFSPNPTNVTADIDVYAVFDNGAIIAEGDCNENVSWRLYESNILTIYGEGAMNNYTSKTNQPWYNYAESINVVIVDEGITFIGNHAFDSLANITRVDIPDSVTNIGTHAFYGCTSLTNIKFPDSITSIGAYAFYNCTSLISVIIPDSVTSIGTNVFYNCTSLISVIIPDSITSIGAYAFYGCISLARVSSFGSITELCDYTFNGCTNLKYIAPLNKITIIGSRVFYNCSSLTCVTIPSSVKRIGKEAFANCDNLTYANFSSTTGWRSVGSSTATTGASINSTSLGNVETAATCLTSTYKESYWYDAY